LEASQPAPTPTAESGAAEDAIFVKTDYRVVKVSIGDIRYIEGMSEYLKLHLESQPKPVITLLAMKKLEERLPQNFMRIHRSYIVNLDKIQEVNKNRVILDSDTYLPIGDLYKEQFNDYLASRFLGK
jgi:DNA-binding LytR/AlgR family response regulator